MRSPRRPRYGAGLAWTLCCAALALGAGRLEAWPGLLADRLIAPLQSPLILLPRAELLRISASEDSEDELESPRDEHAPLLFSHADRSALSLLQPHGVARERCRPQMRNVLRIGHGASPDGRPESCRLFSFVRRWRMRDAMIGAFRRRELPRLRFLDPRAVDGSIDFTPTVAMDTSGGRGASGRSSGAQRGSPGGATSGPDRRH